MDQASASCGQQIQEPLKFLLTM